MPLFTHTSLLWRNAMYLYTLATNLELVVNLKDPYLESNDLNESYQTQQVLALTYYQQRELLGRNI
jgi:hypothetical protein